MRITPKAFLVTVVAGFGLWLTCPGPKHIALGPGEFAPDAPKQIAIEEVAGFRHLDYTITPLAEFQITAKVLGKENYYWDRQSDLSPVDLALGWGPMSDERNLKSISISQSGRWYYWNTRTPPIPTQSISVHSANMHIIPATSEITDQLQRIIPGQVITMDAQLVEVKSKDGWNWRSSLSRKDTGNGACEILYVRQLRIAESGI